MIIVSRWSEIVYFEGPPTFTENEMGDVIEESGSPRMVFANKISIRQSEFYQAHALGLKPNIAFEVRTEEYQEEENLSYNEKKYRIIRTYEKGEFTELICEGAVNHGAT